MYTKKPQYRVRKALKRLKLNSVYKIFLMNLIEQALLKGVGKRFSRNLIPLKPALESFSIFVFIRQF